MRTMLQLNSENRLEILTIINLLKNEMIHVGLQEGLTSKKTVALSQKLDEYITRYQVMTN
jgi:hypothetical protein